MKIQILDIFKGNAFDADKEKATGTDGVIIKGGQGGAIYEHQSIIKECERVGLPWGIYWVSDARYAPEKHKAAIKIAFPTGDFGQLGIWIDVEKPIIIMPDAIYRLLPYRYAKPVISFAQGIIAYSGKFPGIYTALGAYQLILSGASQAEKEFLGSLDLWTAQYNSHITQPDLYGAWKTWKYWQYMAEPDYSIFNGTEEEFFQMIGETPVPENSMFSQTVNFSNKVQKMKEQQ